MAGKQGHAWRREYSIARSMRIGNGARHSARSLWERLPLGWRQAVVAGILDPTTPRDGDQFHCCPLKEVVGGHRERLVPTSICCLVSYSSGGHRRRLATGRELVEFFLPAVPGSLLGIWSAMLSGARPDDHFGWHAAPGPTTTAPFQVAAGSGGSCSNRYLLCRDHPRVMGAAAGEICTTCSAFLSPGLAWHIGATVSVLLQHATSSVPRAS